MINDNELRIGNLVYDSTGCTTVVESIIPEHNRVRKPITLTEEWLLKFGFGRRESSVCDSFYIGENPVTKDWMFDIVWLKNMMDYTYEDFPFYRNGHFKIQFVHQLQNLYFALTGEELTIK